MIELTPGARERFDDYVRRLRVSLRGSRSIEAEEVEQNVLEHIELALAGVPAPVGADHLGPVLEQLGAPERWLPEEERPFWRTVLERFRSGPDDWRLAYGSFALTFLSVVLLPIGGVLLMVPAYLLSRAYVELLAEKNEPMRARRWLVYPPIVFWLVCFVIIVAVVPVAGWLAWAVGEFGLHRALGLPSAGREWTAHAPFDIGVGVLSFGVWFVMASMLLALLLRPIRFLFAPLLDRLQRRHLWWLVLTGFVLAGLGAAVLWISALA